MPRFILPRFVHPCLITAVLLGGAPALAHDEDEEKPNVGLGVAAGLSFSPTRIEPPGQIERIVGEGFAWGFFVDIPLVSTFYISPAAMLYQIDLGYGHIPVTDIDLNFKFLIPIGPFAFGPGLTAGITHLERRYEAHVGGLGYFSWNFVANLDLFLIGQYKRLFREQGRDIDNIHIYAGIMFRF